MTFKLKEHLGRAWQFKEDHKVTPFMMATNEIRRSGRRGVIPQHVLYMTMKIMRLRVSECLYSTFKCIGETEKITRKMIKDKEFLETGLEKNLSFLKSIPNSVHYWAQRKRDVFAIIWQLGKSTMSLTMSANEIRRPRLLNVLHRLKHD
jgi:hypothetical protein